MLSALHENVFIIDVFDQELIIVLRVNFDENGLDGRVAFDQHTWLC